MNKKSIRFISMAAILACLCLAVSCRKDIIGPSSDDDDASSSSVSTSLSTSSSSISSSTSSSGGTISSSSVTSSSSSSSYSSSSTASSGTSSSSGGDYVVVDYTGGSWQNGKIHYGTPWVHRADAGANTILEFDLMDISGTVDWTKMKLSLSDGTEAEVDLGTYVTGAMPTWTTISIPLSVFGGLDTSQILFFCLKDAGGSGNAVFGLDEIRFTGDTEVCFYGEAYAGTNLESSATVILSFASSGSSSSSSSTSSSSATTSSTSSSSNSGVGFGNFSMTPVGYQSCGVEIQNSLIPQPLTFLSCEAVMNGNADYGLYTMDDGIWVVNGNSMSYEWYFTYNPSNWYIVNAFGARTGTDLKLNAVVSNMGTYLTITYKLENVTPDITLDQVHLHPCMLTRFNNTFTPPSPTYTELHDRLYLWSGGQKFRFADSFNGSNNEPWSAFMKQGATPISWSTWQNDPNTTFTDNLIALKSHDNQYTVGYAWEASIWASANCNGDAACVHLWPDFGSMLPGSVKTVNGRFYMIQGTPDDLYNIYTNDF